MNKEFILVEGKHPEPTESEVLELIGKKEETSKLLKQNWIVQECEEEINRLNEVISRLRTLVALAKNPEVVKGIELFIGKK